MFDIQPIKTCILFLILPSTFFFLFSSGGLLCNIFTVHSDGFPCV